MATKNTTKKKAPPGNKKIGDSEMTILQHRFCDLFLATGNAHFSYIEIFNPEDITNHKIDSLVRKLLDKPAVIKYIKQKEEERHKKYEDLGQEVIGFLTAVMRGESYDEIAMPYKGKFMKSFTRVKNGDRVTAAKILAQRTGVDQPLTGPSVQKMQLEIVYGPEEVADNNDNN